MKVIISIEAPAKAAEKSEGSVFAHRALIFQASLYLTL
ncbi:hypothetical protein BN131_1013 [Cronobacter malonaticus 681]|nr:hypothetical protein BN131_1013 [Cronobacter malonaticus 681]